MNGWIDELMDEQCGMMTVEVCVWQQWQQLGLIDHDDDHDDDALLLQYSDVVYMRVLGEGSDHESHTRGQHCRLESSSSSRIMIGLAATAATGG